MADIQAPFGPADVAVLTATGAQAIAANNWDTVVDGVTVEATGNRTIDLTIAAGLKVGSKLVVLSKTNGTESTIYGTGITAPTVVGVAGKTVSQSFVFDGSGFVASAPEFQID